jgi:hypothetical protein
VNQRSIFFLSLLFQRMLEISEHAEKDFPWGGNALNEQRNVIIRDIVAGHDLMNAVKLSKVKAVDKKWLPAMMDATKEMPGIIDPVDF